MKTHFNFDNIKIDKQAVIEANKGQDKLTSGVHNVTVIGLFPKDKDGYVTFDFIFVTDKGKKGIIFGLSLEEKFASGKDNFRYSRNHALFVNMNCTSFELTEAERTIHGLTSNYPVLKDSIGKKVTIGIQRVYYTYRNKQRNRLDLIESWKYGSIVNNIIINDTVQETKKKQDYYNKTKR